MTRTGSFALAALLALALAAPPSHRADEPAAPAGKAPDNPPPPAEEQPPPAEAPQAPPSTPPPAEEQPPPSEAPQPPAGTSPPPAPPEGSSGLPPGEGTWIDVSHSFVEQRLFAPILRLDRFFSDERPVEAERERSFLRWRSEVRYTQDASRPAFTTGVNATLRFPALNDRLRRLRLVIAGQTRDAVSTLFPKEPGAPANPLETSPEDEALGRGDAGLRFYLWDTLAAHADLGGGFLLELPPGVYGQIRFRWAFPVGPLFLTRTALIGFWRSDVKFGTTATLELDRPVKRWFLLRATGSGTRSERSNGVEWASELAAIVPLPPRSAAQIGVGWSGATSLTTIAPDPTTGLSRAYHVPTLGRTRAYTRLRTDVYRGWLFMEVEPEIAWPWTPERGRYAAWGVALRVEIQFQGKEAPPPAPPPPLPEPNDPPEEPGGSPSESIP